MSADGTVPAEGRDAPLPQFHVGAPRSRSQASGTWPGQPKPLRAHLRLSDNTLARGGGWVVGSSYAGEAGGAAVCYRGFSPERARVGVCADCRGRRGAATRSSAPCQAPANDLTRGLRPCDPARPNPRFTCCDPPVWPRQFAPQSRRSSQAWTVQSFLSTSKTPLQGARASGAVEAARPAVVGGQYNQGTGQCQGRACSSEWLPGMDRYAASEGALSSLRVHNLLSNWSTPGEKKYTSWHTPNTH